MLDYIMSLLLKLKGGNMYLKPGTAQHCAHK